MPERGRARDDLDALSDAAVAEYLRRSSISFLECAINLMASHMSLEEVAAILQAEAADLLELG